MYKLSVTMHLSCICYTILWAWIRCCTCYSNVFALASRCSKFYTTSVRLVAFLVILQAVLDLFCVNFFYSCCWNLSILLSCCILDPIACLVFIDGVLILLNHNIVGWTYSCPNQGWSTLVCSKRKSLWKRACAENS